MNIFSRIFGKKNDEYSPKFRIEMAKRLDRKFIKYVTEREEDGSETILGKEGCIYTCGELLRVVSTSGKVFEGRIVDLLMSELMSGDGVIIHGPDLMNDGKVRKLVAYYTYYSKPVRADFR
jgi:hypothetical protein